MAQDQTVAAAVVDALKEMGVRHVFGVPSGGWVDYMEALRTTDGIDFILTTHEGGAGMMADVCGRLTGAPGVCFGTYGPGATNLATGVGEALLDRSPMIALTDEMPAAMRGRTTQMGIDHQALFAPLTKKTTRLREARCATSCSTPRASRSRPVPAPFMSACRPACRLRSRATRGAVRAAAGAGSGRSGVLEPAAHCRAARRSRSGDRPWRGARARRRQDRSAGREPACRWC